MPVFRTNLDALRENVLAQMPGQGDMRKALQAIGAAAHAHWVGLAQDRLKSTARDYIQGISAPQVQKRSVSIQLVGVLPNMVEEGWPATDLRTTVLRSPRAKTAKDGSRYMAIPFRHGTPGTGGRNVGNAMPRAIHSAAKLLTAQSTQAALTGMGIRAQGSRLGLTSFGLNRNAKKILETKAKEWHSGSIYLGMIRSAATYSTGKAVTSSYNTFRMISTNSKDPRSWQHPGIKAARLVAKVSDFAVTIAGQIIRDASQP